MRRATRREKIRMSKIVDDGCIVCRREFEIYTPAGVHHCTRRQKRSHARTIALCDRHHQHGGEGVAIHPYWKLFEEKFGTEEELLEATNQMVDSL